MRRAGPPRSSLQRRLSLGLVAGVTLLWLAATGAASFVVRHEIDEVFDGALQSIAQRVLPLAYGEWLNRENSPLDDTPVQTIASATDGDEYISYVVRDSKGVVLMQSRDSVGTPFPDNLAPGFHNGPGYRYFTVGAVRGTLFVTTLETPGHRQSTVWRAIRSLIWPLFGLIPLSLIGVWGVTRFTLRPLIAFRTEIEARGDGNLSAVTTAALPAEIRPLAVAVNHLLQRLRHTLEAERSFTANSAHELRTPVAAALAQTQRLISELDEGPGRERARAIASALKRLARLSEKLMQLAKAEGGSLIGERAEDMVVVLRYVLEDSNREHDAADRLIVTLPQSGRALSIIDADAFAVLARNLVENALKHAPIDSEVQVTLGEDLAFEVSNECPAIAPDVVDRLRRPFERGVTEANGAGLGLAIADAVARGAGSALEIFSPRPGKSDGFLARVVLPRDRKSSQMQP
ncbi:sensor histidine kinase [Oryzibacter oryziterrae]|uniref:sensor histidine kinase n=1 Tax=Oryzibacter oryziterrae TaxID=2766474 RepID=UPI001F33E762|nr:ATP-binding protein [Oryzibacter oryziterrae]